MTDKPLLATDRAALILQLVPYLIGKGEVSLAEAADEFDVSEAQMRGMVETWQSGMSAMSRRTFSV